MMHLSKQSPLATLKTWGEHDFCCSMMLKMPSNFWSIFTRAALISGLHFSTSHNSFTCLFLRKLACPWCKERQTDHSQSTLKKLAEAASSPPSASGSTGSYSSSAASLEPELALAASLHSIDMAVLLPHWLFRLEYS